MKTMKFLTLALFTGVLAFAPAALADKGGNGNGHKPEWAGAAPESAAPESKGDRDTVFGFNDKEVAVITGVLEELYGGDKDKEVTVFHTSRKFCPPGLAKKNNGCLQPGLAKKYTIGEILPEDTLYSELSGVLRDVLGLPPKGKKYVQVDNDVLLLTEGTNIVLDAIGITNN